MIKDIAAVSARPREAPKSVAEAPITMEPMERIP